MDNKDPLDVARKIHNGITRLGDDQIRAKLRLGAASGALVKELLANNQLMKKNEYLRETNRVLQNRLTGSVEDNLRTSKRMKEQDILRRMSDNVIKVQDLTLKKGKELIDELTGERDASRFTLLQSLKALETAVQSNIGLHKQNSVLHGAFYLVQDNQIQRDYTDNEVLQLLDIYPTVLNGVYDAGINRAKQDVHAAQAALEIARLQNQLLEAKILAEKPEETKQKEHFSLADNVTVTVIGDKKEEKPSEPETEKERRYQRLYDNRAFTSYLISMNKSRIDKGLTEYDSVEALEERFLSGKSTEITGLEDLFERTRVSIRAKEFPAELEAYAQKVQLTAWKALKRNGKKLTFYREFIDPEDNLGLGIIATAEYLGQEKGGIKKKQKWMQDGLEGWTVADIPTKVILIEPEELLQICRLSHPGKKTWDMSVIVLAEEEGKPVLFSGFYERGLIPRDKGIEYHIGV